MYWKLILKSPGFVPFGANLTLLRGKSISPAVPSTRAPRCRVVCCSVRPPARRGLVSSANNMAATSRACRLLDTALPDVSGERQSFRNSNVQQRRTHSHSYSHSYSRLDKIRWNGSEARSRSRFNRRHECACAVLLILPSIAR